MAKERADVNTRSELENRLWSLEAMASRQGGRLRIYSVSVNNRIVGSRPRLNRPNQLPVVEPDISHSPSVSLFAVLANPQRAPGAGLGVAANLIVSTCACFLSAGAGGSAGERARHRDRRLVRRGVQVGLKNLARRGLISVCRASITAVPGYAVMAPWVRE